MSQQEITAMVGRFTLTLGSIGLVAFLSCTSMAQTVATPTLWNWLGIPASVNRVRDSLVNRRGHFPGLERRPRLRRIGDPELAKIDNSAIQKAQQIKAEEDLAPQKIKAVKYLAKIGCGVCYKGVDEALLEASKDCTEAVRYQTVKAIGGTRNKKCSHCDNNCCSDKIVEQLAKMAYERDEEHPDCWYEPSERVRKAAKESLKACCPGSTPPRLLEIEDEPIDRQPPEPEGRQPLDREPEARSDATAQTTTDEAASDKTTKFELTSPAELAPETDLPSPSDSPPAALRVVLRRENTARNDPPPTPLASKPPVTGLVWQTTARVKSPASLPKNHTRQNNKRPSPFRPHNVKKLSSRQTPSSGRKLLSDRNPSQPQGEKSILVQRTSAEEPITNRPSTERPSHRVTDRVCPKCGKKHQTKHGKPPATQNSQPRSLYDVFFAPRPPSRRATQMSNFTNDRLNH